MRRKIRNVVKKVASAGLCGIMVLGLTACGASGAMKETASMDMVAPEESYKSSVSMDSAWNDSYAKVEVESAGGVISNSAMTQGTVTDSSVTTRKTIKTAHLNLQTLEFDAFAGALDAKIQEVGAYLQYANVSGKNYYGGRRSANYTVRVPQQHLDAFLAGVEGIATVTSKTLGEEDVTLSYVDTESRLKSLQIEQERLFALLEKADSLDAIIKLENRLSEVRYQIENYQAQLRTYDDKIAYSTVNIYVSEVTRVTEPEAETLWERIQRGWSDTMYDIAVGAADFVVWFISNIPYLVFWAVVIVAGVMFVRKKRNQRLKNNTRKQRENNESKMDNQE